MIVIKCQIQILYLELYIKIAMNMMNHRILQLKNIWVILLKIKVSYKIS